MKFPLSRPANLRRWAGRYSPRTDGMNTPNNQKLIQQAIKLHTAGSLDQATRLYLQVLTTEPDNFDALNLSGAAAMQSGDAAGAVELIQQALSRGKLSGPRDAHAKRLGDAYNNLAVACQKLRKFDEALAAGREALKYRPKDADLLANTGLILKELGEYEEAEMLLRRSLSLNPRQVRALISLGLILHITGRRDEAEKFVTTVLKLQPRSAPAHNLYASILSAQGDADAAMRSFDAAIECDPQFPDAPYNRALLNLSLGRFGAAWTDIYRHHPTRRGSATGQEPLPARLDGKHVFVNRNQGLGDELFYLRFVPFLKERGAKCVTYRTQERMLGFAKRLPFIDEVMPNDIKQFSADHIVLVDFLPYFLQLGDAEAPSSIKLLAQPESLRRIALRLQQAGPPPYLGVTWRAGRMRSEVDFRKEATEVLFKEIPPDSLGETLRHWPGTVLILQRNPIAAEVACFQTALGRAAVDCSDVNDDLEDMLALLSMVERYVTVSNTNLHLRAAAGLPSHVLVPTPPEWRWGYGPGRSLWFPQSPVYRQERNGDWQRALKQLGEELLR